MATRAPRTKAKAQPEEPPKPEGIIWLYCLLKSAKKPALGKTPPGPPEAEAPRLLDAGGGLWLLVSDAPSITYGEAPLNARLSDLDWVGECALAHEAVVTHARGKVKSVAPMKLFTLFRDEARALTFVTSDRKRLERVLSRVEGCAEFGVRLSLDQAKARAHAEAEAAKRAPAASSGMGFLARKQAMKQAAVNLDVRGQQEASSLFASLEEVAQAARRRPEVEGLSEGTRLLMDGVFLVQDDRAAAFRKKAQAAERALQREGFTVTLTGPWPAYHFVVDAA